MKRLILCCIIVVCSGCDVITVTPTEWLAAVKACEGLGGLDYLEPSRSQSSYNVAYCKSGVVRNYDEQIQESEVK